MNIKLEMSNIYNIVVHHDITKDLEDIYNVFKQIKNGVLENNIKLLNYYCEIPINYKGTIKEVFTDNIEIITHKIQAIVIATHKETIIKTKHLPYSVLAKFVSINTDKDTVVVVPASYVEIKAEKREFLRIKTTEPFYVINRYKGFLAELLDISLSGFSVISTKKHDFNIGDEIKLLIKSKPPNPIKLIINSIFCAYHDLSGEYKYVFQIKPCKKTEDLVANFIAEQQFEIINELKFKYF